MLDGCGEIRGGTSGICMNAMFLLNLYLEQLLANMENAFSCKVSQMNTDKQRRRCGPRTDSVPTGSREDKNGLFREYLFGAMILPV
jgi:hypothetical protein